MEISKINVNKAYNEFIDCIFEGQIDMIKYKQFISKIVGNGMYQEVQLEFFNNLLKSSKKNAQVKRIGSIICFLSEGHSISKVKQLTQHIKKYYGDSDISIKEFINDIIDINTDNCYLSFKSKINPEVAKHLIEVWKKPRKSKLFYKIYENYESACKKYLTQIEKLEAKNKTQNNIKENKDNSKDNSKDNNKDNTTGEIDLINNTNKLLTKSNSCNLSRNEKKDKEEKEELCKIKLFIDLSFSSLDGNNYIINIYLI